MLSPSTPQIDELDNHARSFFLESTFDYLKQSFPDIPSERQKSLFLECLEYCSQYGILTEYGIFSFSVLSFSSGYSLGDDELYHQLQRRGLSVGLSPDDVIISLYESAYAWEG